MKSGVIVAGVMLFLFMMSCNKSDLQAPGTSPPNTNTSKYSGTYTGQYEVSNNGVDSNGVFKNDSSYAYLLKVEDIGNDKIIIAHGPVAFPTVTVDANSHFSFEDFNHNITGYFVNDSLYLSSISLNGYDDSIYFVGSWFVIQKLSFKGKREL